MATSFQVTFDCTDPDRVARFWAEALGYRLPDPPEGFATWGDFLAANGVPESEWGSASAAQDPDGAGPRLYFQRVPEGKVAKNRVHLDLNVSGGRAVPVAERVDRIRAEVRRLEALGATRVTEVDHDQLCEFWIVMQDPEGNEFCLQ